MCYFYVGLYIYIVACIINYDSFKNAKLRHIIKGILGVLIWPLLIFVFIIALKELSKNNEKTKN